ncbi:pyrroline-5-carboxylate reductase dimerization domain-containing protein [Alisedimentitalea sp. MJ-SS2]|uniref:pyrroline-5-carboxylate reductase family protein n=1 Tax=Aliisedimentitalea sp. MJ-SS2 TaxID=3049795 RepID=UPI00291182CF|nr:pyrroline-5-carboxylate reductase dimerization domain-containing protein [Alisedimentitalea sp. MJ-SS2]MDU8926951.1 pyrroline-5-carboxylate reductase dimerization domain-containing protein [Alisedimentitalea sp. MJ-SS2]
MKLGVIGVGHLAGSILRGLSKAGITPSDIHLSPRGHGPDLAQRYDFVLTPDNRTLVDQCDIVLLAVRPADAGAAVRGLPWRAGQVLVSACAGVTLKQLAAEAAPAAVVRIMPLTASELGASPTVVFPMRPELRPLLDAIGSTIALQSEDQFETATVSAAIYGWAQALIRTGVDWSANHGLDPALARQLVARTFVAAGRMQSEHEASMDEILTSLCTPGGITEAGLNHLESQDMPEAWQDACDIVLKKLRGET